MEGFFIWTYDLYRILEFELVGLYEKGYVKQIVIVNKLQIASKVNDYGSILILKAFALTGFVMFNIFH